MAPIISNHPREDEELILNSLKKFYPSLRVDMLVTSAAVKDGENFMGVVTKVDAIGHLLNNGKSIKVSVAMKSMPQSLERRLTFNCDAAFSNEAFLYSTVLPSMSKLCKLPFPTCLYASNKCIILRHLGQDGYVMADRMQGLDLQHCQLVLRELGKFHAVSLALKHLKPEEYNQISSSIIEIFITTKNLIFEASVDNCIDMALKVVTNSEASVVTRLKKIRGHGLEVLSPLATSSGPLAVICHGDVWSNNLLFRYSSEYPKTPSDVCFLDLQACRHGSPALDILYFLFTSGRPGVVRQHFKELMTLYHRSLVDHLKLLAPTAPAITLDDVMAEAKRYAVYGLVMSVMVLPVVTSENLTINFDDIKEDSLQSQQFQEKAEREFLTPEFKRRINENFEVFMLEGLI